MAICKICGRFVSEGPVMHGECLEQLVEKTEEELCDGYCKWPLTDAERLEEACKNCPMDRLLKLIKQ